MTKKYKLPQIPLTNEQIEAITAMDKAFDGDALLKSLKELDSYLDPEHQIEAHQLCPSFTRLRH